MCVCGGGGREGGREAERERERERLFHNHACRYFPHQTRYGQTVRSANHPTQEDVAGSAELTMAHGVALQGHLHGNINLSKHYGAGGKEEEV